MRSDRIYSAYIAKAGRELKNHLLEGLEFIKWKSYVKKDSTVFIKPNFTFPSHRKGVTTSPELLRSLIQIVGQRSNRLVIGESDGGDNSFRADQAFKGHGMNEICRDLGAELVNLSNLPSVFIESKVQGKRVKVQLPRLLVDEVDCFISVPVLKVHVVTSVSLGLKNLWGCVPDTLRGLYHSNLAHKLALICRLVNPKLTIIDGLYALDGHGPMFGIPRKTDLLILSDNVVVADTLGAKIMGIPPDQVKHIVVTEKEKIGTTDLTMVNVNTDWSQYRTDFRIRRTFLDEISVLTFNYDSVSRLIMSSPFTAIIYRIIEKLRSAEEKEVAEKLGSKHYGLTGTVSGSIPQT